ncbi:hypothetical protein KAT08_02970 [Candidatus Babeliales bacterium]|nr:hypothetical protein [Candidatus Babeliales bacterium]
MKNVLFLSCVIFTTNICATIDNLQSQKDIPNINNNLIQQDKSNIILKKIDDGKKQQDKVNTFFNQEELSELIAQKLQVAEKEKKEKTQAIIKSLRKFKITGIATTVDPNLALIFDIQNPILQVIYKNSIGEIKTRKYQALVKSIGLKLEFDFKIDLIFIVGTDFNFYDSDKTIELGPGIDLKTNIIDFTYASFNNHDGGMIILGIPILGELSNFLTYGISLCLVGISYVSGGYLIPIES